MKTFNVLDYSNWNDLSEVVRTDLLENVTFPISANHKMFGPCTIENIKVSMSDSSADLMIDLKLSDGQIKKYSLKTLYQLGHLTIDESQFEVISDYITLISELYDERMFIVREENRKRMEAELQAKVDAKKAKALEAKKRQVDAKINSLQPLALTSDYAILGWLARNVSTISAVVNSDYEEWFTKNFGIVEHSVVDSSAKTTAGDPMKYSLSFRASFKTELPAQLQTLKGVDKRVINSVEYIWNLIETYGFKFGKTQDIELIRSKIPTEFITDFETGYGPDPEPKKTKSSAKKKLIPTT
jgi:hypothetical protein